MLRDWLDLLEDILDRLGYFAEKGKNRTQRTYHLGLPQQLQSYPGPSNSSVSVSGWSHMEMCNMCAEIQMKAPSV